MSGRTITMLAVAVTLGLVVLVFVQLNSVGHEGVGVGVKTAAAECTDPSPSCLPGFSMTAINGRVFTHEELAGKVVIVNFWATWCAPCRQEVPDLAAVHQRHRKDGLVILGVLRDQPSDDVLIAFTERYGLTYPVVRTDDAIEYAFGAPANLPTTYIYGRDGRLADKREGSLSETELEAAVAELLASR